MKEIFNDLRKKVSISSDEACFMPDDMMVVSESWLKQILDEAEAKWEAERNDKWIPAKETPEKVDRYLCDVIVHGERRIVIAKYDNHWKIADGLEILAWQPLPEYYQPKGA